MIAGCGADLIWCSSLAKTVGNEPKHPSAKCIAQCLLVGSNVREDVQTSICLRHSDAGRAY